MKIAMIGQKGIPAHSGGVERHVEEIGERLVKLGHSVTVYCRKHYNSSFPSNYKGMKIKVIPTINTASLDAISYTLLATLDALKCGYDLIHYHAIGPASLVLLPYLLGKKTVVTVHGLDWQRAKWGKIAKAYLKFGEFIAGNYSTKCILVSEALHGYFYEKYRDYDRFIVIPNGVNVEESYPPQMITDLGLKKDEYILFLARLVPEKGCHYLIEAFKQLATEKKLVIAGGSSHTDAYVDRLRELARDDNRIVFTGVVKDRLLNELYSHAYIYVLPSEIEGMPLTLLEAMSFGTFPLVSNIPENVMVVGNNFGYQFENKNVESLRKGLDYCLKNSEYIASKRKECREYVKNQYDWDKIVIKLNEVYKGIIPE
jgi:glycosyltransferase involved in cell wall biosynthesis